MTPSSSRPLNKVLVGAFLAGTASALVILVAWLISLAGVTMPDDVRSALLIVFSVVGSLLGGYYTPIAPGEVKPTDMAGTVVARREL